MTISNWVKCSARILWLRFTENEYDECCRRRQSNSVDRRFLSERWPAVVVTVCCFLWCLCREQIFASVWLSRFPRWSSRSAVVGGQSRGARRRRQCAAALTADQYRPNVSSLRQRHSLNARRVRSNGLNRRYRNACSICLLSLVVHRNVFKRWSENDFQHGLRRLAAQYEQRSTVTRLQRCSLQPQMSRLNMMTMNMTRELSNLFHSSTTHSSSLS